MGGDYQVEYAADLNAKKYGNGFGMRNQKLRNDNQKHYVNHPWNLANF